jgi:hypothetical protein
MPSNFVSITTTEKVDVVQTYPDFRSSRVKSQISAFNSVNATRRSLLQIIGRRYRVEEKDGAEVEGLVVIRGGG